MVALSVLRNSKGVTIFFQKIYYFVIYHIFVNDLGGTTFGNCNMPAYGIGYHIENSGINMITTYVGLNFHTLNGNMGINIAVVEATDRS